MKRGTRREDNGEQFLCVDRKDTSLSLNEDTQGSLTAVILRTTSAGQTASLSSSSFSRPPLPWHNSLKTERRGVMSKEGRLKENG